MKEVLQNKRRSKIHNRFFLRCDASLKTSVTSLLNRNHTHILSTLGTCGALTNASTKMLVRDVDKLRGSWRDVPESICATLQASFEGKNITGIGTQHIGLHLRSIALQREFTRKILRRRLDIRTSVDAVAKLLANVQPLHQCPIVSSASRCNWTQSSKSSNSLPQAMLLSSQ